MQNNKLTFLFALYENSNYVKKRAGSLREICKNIGFQDSSNNYEILNNLIKHQVVYANGNEVRKINVILYSINKDKLLEYIENEKLFKEVYQFIYGNMEHYGLLLKEV